MLRPGNKCSGLFPFLYRVGTIFGNFWLVYGATFAYAKGNETMTLLTSFGIAPTHRGNTLAPCELALSDLTIVVPVKNNQIGVLRLLEACLRMFAPNRYPAEILLVDNTVSGRWWYVKIGGEETSETGGSHAHQVSKGDPGE